MIKLAALMVFALVSARTLAEDLSRYRDFRFGSDLATVARQAGMSPSQAKVIQQRPALIQELPWRPQPSGSSARTEPVQEVVFSFYNGELFRIVASYDRYETEGLTAADIIDALSVTYGTSAKVPAKVNVAVGNYSDQDELIAQWQDSEFRFELMRSAYAVTYKLVGVLRKLEAPVQASIINAARLDASEAPQREAEQTAKRDEVERAKLEKARLVNKPKFRP